MIEQLLNREFVLDQLRQVIAHLDGANVTDASGSIDPGTRAELLQELASAEAAESQASSGQDDSDNGVKGRRRDSAPSLDDVSFFSHQAVISNLQSALEEYYEGSPDAVEETRPTSDDRRNGSSMVAVTDRRLKGAGGPLPGSDRRLFNRFSITDPGWVCSPLAEGIRRLRGKHDFPLHAAPAHAIAPDARLLVVGDWASGLPRAIDVANVMRAVLDDGVVAEIDQHVVHLGDVYYSGWKREYEKRFLPHWPVRAKEARSIGSWSVNSNHDMYSGGYGYFDTLLADPRFWPQARSSYFSLVNDHWRILGLDTAWETGRVQGPQLDWFRGQADEARAVGQKLMLLSHHPLFDAGGSVSEGLHADLQPVLKAGGVDVWLWGHKHTLMTFAPHLGVRHARCIGHGGVPVYMWRGDNEAVPAPGEFEYRARFRTGLEYWAVMGFAVLDLDGPAINVRYLNEFGDEHRSERLV